MWEPVITIVPSVLIKIVLRNVSPHVRDVSEKSKYHGYRVRHDVKRKASCATNSPQIQKVAPANPSTSASAALCPFS